MSHSSQMVRFFFLCCCLGLLPTPDLRAQTTWKNAAGGLWNTPDNWYAGVPNSSSDANFEFIPGSFTVTFDVSPSIPILTMYDGNVTFSMTGHTLNVTGDIFAPYSVLFGGIAGENGRVTILNGTVISKSVGIATSPAANGTLTVSTGGHWDTVNHSTSVGINAVGGLNVINGGTYATGDLNVGSMVGSVSVSGIGSALSMTSLWMSGSSTATISGGATATGTSSAQIAAGANSISNFTVTGAGSSLHLASSLHLGEASGAAGSMTVSAGGSLTSSTTILGNAANATGTVTVTGPGSSWSNTNQMILGSAGAGSLTVSSGGTVATGSLLLGSLSNSSGTVAVTGNGSSLSTVSNVTIGSLGTGAMSITGGGTLTAGGTTTVASGFGTLTLDGGTLDTVQFIRNGVFNFNDGILHVRGNYTANPAAASLVINGNDDAALPTLWLSGNSAVSNVTSLVVGNNRRGSFVIDNGRSLSLGAQNISIGALAGGNGAVTITGNGSTLANTLNLDIGGTNGTAGGTGSLTINPGALVSTNGTLSLHALGTLSLNGGTLYANTLNANGGHVNFNSGTVNLTAASTTLGSPQLDALLGAGHMISFGQTLTTNALTLNTPLSLTGGGVAAGGTLTNNGTLSLNDGMLSVGSNLVNNPGRLLQISNTGALQVVGNINNNGTLLLNDNFIAPLSGGNLVNSGVVRGSGVVGSNLTNNAAGQVQLTAGNRLEFQGPANTNTGLISLNGGELVFTGLVTNSAATGLISGRDAILRTGGLTNNGSLAFSNGTMDVFGKITNDRFVTASDRSRITVSGGGIANFYDDVHVMPGQTDVQASAVGSTISSVVFFGTYNGGVTGGGTAFLEGDHRPGNSPAHVVFGGDVFYGGSSTLHIELGGYALGSQYDSVSAAGQVTLAGGLDVTLLNGFVPTGNSLFTIVDNQGPNPISGIFSGLPEGSFISTPDAAFFISYHGGDGNDVVLIAVPEPTTWALLGLAGGASGWYAWRRKQRGKKAAWLED
jgi:T5SS/PEP-CTERM-associated repeat protein